MAIAETGAIYKAFSFDNVSSRDYGVYITGDVVYDAPERDVEMISIPGRNGAFALDRGRFENIEVKYPAGIYAENESDFAQAISDFRNFLCSRKGYVRLSDEYNPSEYRMAVYKSGLEVNPTQLKAGEFEIIFECMPQRWLTSGESKISISDGDTITNPTMFDAHPLLEVEGYGRISLNGYTINIDDGDYGETVSTPFVSSNASGEITFDDTHLNTDDNVWLNNVRVVHTAKLKSGYTFRSSQTVSVTEGATASIDDKGKSRKLNIAEIALSYGTTYSAQYRAIYNWATAKYNGTASLTLTLDYDGAHTISYAITYDVGTPFSTTGKQINAETIRTESTVVALGHPTYIDLDIGVAWNEDSGDVASMNNVVELPFELPVLASGENIISFDNTVTDLKIVPRWWKV